MSVIYFIVALSIVRVSCAQDNRERVKSDLDGVFIVPEDRNWEIKLSEDLIGFRAESIGKLNNINKKIPDNLEDIINSKLNALERKLPEKLEEYLESKFYALEKNNKEIQKNFEKLQNYVDSKFTSLERHIYRKIDALEQLIPDKTDTNIINHKLDALKKIQLGLDGNNTCSLTALTNETSAMIKEILNNKFADLEENINDTTTKTCFKFEAFDNSLADLQKNLNKVPPELQIIRNKLDVLDNKIPQLNKNKVSLNMEELENKILSLNKNVTNELHKLNKQVNNNIDHALGEVRDQFPSIEMNVNKKIDDLYRLEENVLEEIYNTECKKLTVNRNIYATPFIGINDEALNNIIVKYDSDSNVDFFEFHFAIKTDSEVMSCTLLAPRSTINFDTEIAAFQICIKSRVVYVYKLKQLVATETYLMDLSPRQYTAFYIKIDQGTLEVGWSGSSTPLLTYTDSNLNILKYFTFGGRHNQITNYLYDCPVNHSKQLI